MADLGGLEYEQVEVPLVQGVDTRDDPRAIPLGKLVEMENLEINRVGRMEVRRGMGWEAAGPGAPPWGGTGDTAINGLASRGVEPVVYGTRRAHVYDPVKGSYQYRGRAPGPPVTSRIVQADARGSLTLQDMATKNGITVVASLEAPEDHPRGDFATYPWTWSIRVTVLDDANGVELASWVYTNPNVAPAEGMLWETFPIVVAGTLGHFWVLVPYVTQNAGTSGTDITIQAIVIDPSNLGTKPAVTQQSYTNGATTTDYGAALNSNPRYVQRLVVDARGVVTTAMIAFPTTDGTIKLVQVNTSGVFFPMGTVQGNATWGINLATHASDPTKCLLTYSSGSNVRAYTLTNATVTSGPIVVDASIGSTPNVYRIGAVATGVTGPYGAEYVVMYETDYISPYDPTAKYWNQTRVVYSAFVTEQGGVAHPKSSGNSNYANAYVALMSRPFMYDGQCYVVLAEQTGRSYFLVDLNYVDASQWVVNGNVVSLPDDPLNLVSTIHPQNGGGIQETLYFTPIVASSIYRKEYYNADMRHLTSPAKAGSRVSFALPQAVSGQPKYLQLASEIDSMPYLDPVLWTKTATSIATASFDSAYRGVDLDGDMHLAGGAVAAVDQHLCCEVGFAWEPYRLKATAAATGATTFGLDAGTYAYKVVYAFRRSDGTVERSAPSRSVSVTFAAKSAVTLTFAPLTLTNKTTQHMASPDFTAEIYRTENLGTDVYYLLGSVSVPVGAALDVSTTDRLPDDDLARSSALYTTGGALLPAFMPPSARSIIEHKGRLVLSGCEDATRVKYSGYLTPGEAVWFNPALELIFPEPIVACASMDDALYAFSPTSVWVVFGDGPLDSGADDNFTKPARVTGDVGCIDPRSVVVIPGGVLFQSARGIFLLDRSRQLSYVGADVEKDLASYPTVTSAVLLQDRRHVRFTCLSADGTTGATLTYFYEYGQWGRAVYKRQGSSNALGATGATLVGGGQYWLGGVDTKLYKEQALYADANGLPIPQKFTTGSIGFGKMAGFRRCRKVQLLGRKLSPADVTMTFVTDDDATQTEVASLPGATADLLEHRMGYQRCSRVQVSIAVTPTTNDAGYQLNSLVFEVGSRRGMKRVPATARG